MHNLLHEANPVSNPDQRETLATYEEHFSTSSPACTFPKSPSRITTLVEEYDFASPNSIISELISLAESQTEFAYNTTIQKLVDEIRSADQRVNNYRTDYDSIVIVYNRFIDKNRERAKRHRPK